MLNAIYCYVVTNNAILHPIRLEFLYFHSFNLVYYLISTCIWEYGVANIS
jgi:hypothetical protein